jgi:hypothetical protein
MDKPLLLSSLDTLCTRAAERTRATGRRWVVLLDHGVPCVEEDPRRG